MGNAIVKNIVTKKPNTWTKPDGGFPEITRSADGSIVKAEYVELPTGELMIIEYELNQSDPEAIRQIKNFEAIEKGEVPEFKAKEQRIQIPSTSPQAKMQTASTANRPKTSGNTQRRPVNRAGKKTFPAGKIAILVCVVLAIGIAGTLILKKKNPDKGKNPAPPGKELTQVADNTSEQPTTTETDTTTEDNDQLSIYTMAGSASGSDEAEEASTEQPVIEFNPHPVESTMPSNLIASTEVCVDGQVLSSISDYAPSEEIEFDLGEKYTDVEGIVTFRGNNFRNNPTYGHTNIKNNELEGVWSVQTGSLSFNDESWSGSGWTGQPLIVKWPKQTKAKMNMFDWAKEKDDLVEVIYACMDGYIYFIDLETGEKTRDSMYLGYTFKGSGALDPRGYPIMYVGAGYDSVQGSARVFIINLLDCSVMHTFGNGDPFTMRGNLSYFDSSALVDAETDTLIYPGENGVLYLMKLGTEYNEEAGTLSINPEHVVKWRYKGVRTSSAAYWSGMEDSAVIYKGYLYIMDNGGNFFCLNLNTLELVWAQDSLDDSNSTPVLSIEDGKVYLYASTSFHIGWRSSSSATIPIWKVDAETGEIIWQTEYTCQSEQGVSGGVQSTIAVGENDLSDYIYVTVSRTGGLFNGVLSCISKESGEVIWEHVAAYTWSSPVCVYNEDGEGRVIYCSSNGKMYLMNGKSGDVYTSLALSKGCIEASPAVYNDYAVVGTRACRIWAVKLK